MKKILVSHKVNDIEWWLANNSIEFTWGKLGVKYEIFTQKNSNTVVIVAELPEDDFIDFMLTNTTLASTSMKADGVIIESLQIFEQHQVP
jgi:hypothetical protein